MGAIGSVPVLASPDTVPGEATNLRWCTASKTCLQWNAVSGATGYRLHRGERASLPCVLNLSLDSCDDGLYASTSTGNILNETPAVDRFYWYLIVAENGSGAGSAGTATAGPRIIDNTGSCSPTCAVSESSCSVQGDCCSASCAGGVCQSLCCRPTGASCAGNLDCCSGTCSMGVCQAPCMPTGGSCSQGSQCCSGLCSGGLCQPQCTQPTGCPGTDNDCRTRTCTGGVCGFSYAPAGTAVGAQTPGDCHRLECDGAGNIVSVVDDSDLPADDGNQCTSEMCSGGVPSHPNRPLNFPCNQGGGQVCSPSGTCVQCNSASQCPGTDNECRTRSCSAFTCGATFAPAGTATSSQTPGDCHRNQCDGAGNIVNVVDDSDVPADDGNQCTSEVCSGGVPLHVNRPVNSPCNQNGGQVCSSNGTCVQCNSASQCPGSDTECQSRSCSAFTCGVTFASAGTVTGSQTPGDCHRNQCDGGGNIVSAVDDSDLPADDGNQCTSEMCSGGVPSHPNRPLNFPCNQNGGQVCSPSGTCVQCNSASQCPGSDTQCQTRSCSAFTCGFTFAQAGTPTGSQTPGDCHQNQCDGAGGTTNAIDNSDLPADDGNQCTGEACTSGVPTHPNLPTNTPCSQGGGTVCDGSGSCTTPLSVVSRTPADGSVIVASASNIAITFNRPVDPTSLVTQTSAGACTGSVQVSLDGFSTCISFSSSSAVMSGGNTIATFTVQPSFLVSRTYLVRVKSTVRDAQGVTLAGDLTDTAGFTTTSPNLCDGSLVISQVYGAGGLSGAVRRNDFVELHNRGTSSISVSGMSIQYASATGTTWLPTTLSGSVAPGGYYLIQLFSGGTNGTTLPTPDATNTTDMASAAGKVALVSNTTPLSGACPLGGTVIDFIGYGSTATCSEGGVTAPSPSTTTSDSRLQTGCSDVNVNGSDFTAGTVNPRNSASAPSICACTVRNESGAAAEADYCTVQFPLSMNVQAGTTTPTVFGQVFETGVTEAAGANALVRAQLGYGPPSANPEYQAGWTFVNASYNVQAGNNDEYQASFTAPTAGSYRYVYRFSLDQGVSWTYCDANQGDSGAGSNPGLVFDLTTLNVLTTTP